MSQWIQNAILQKSVSVDRMLPILKKSKLHFERVWENNPKSTAKLSQFLLVQTLGSGTYGKVMLVRYIASSKKIYYAMKIMMKRKVIRSNAVRHVLNEKKILQSVKFPFLVNYKYHFKDNANLFLITEYVPGGDIFTNLKRKGKFEENLTRFYAAQICLAFEYLHYVGIVYRDLKPENILIDRFGFLKIADFGFAKKIDDKTTKTICGTPEYYAPEMLKHKDYSYSVDWWTLGILIYEMSYGKPPFRASNLLALFDLIIENKVFIPEFFSQLTTNIIKSLLTSVNKRPSSANELKENLYFKEIAWTNLYNKNIVPPYIPQITSDNDTQYFDKQEEHKIEELTEDVYAEEFKDF
ncbi:hypothetical protein PGB90_007985 [Kerria lacca]